MRTPPLRSSVLVPTLLLATSLAHALIPAPPVKTWTRAMCFGRKQAELTREQKELLLEVVPTAEPPTDPLHWRASVSAAVAREEDLGRGRDIAESVAEHLERTMPFEVRTDSGWNPLAAYSSVRQSSPTETPLPNEACKSNEDAVEVTVEIYEHRRK